jgi:tetratricopeptide (TPR) repeat protein
MTTMKFILTLTLTMMVSSIAFAQSNEKSETILKDAVDLSLQKEQIKKYGVPTVEIVDQMKAKADSLYAAQMWEQAAGAYEVFAQSANWLSNLISQCVEPYYSASYDDRKAVPYNTLKTFIPIETKANDYKRQRDEAYVRIGLCYKNLGDINNAVTYLHKGLDLLSIDNTTYWLLAKDALSEILGVRSY